jgi:hypothetical protein
MKPVQFQPQNQEQETVLEEPEEVYDVEDNYDQLYLRWNKNVMN